MQRRNALEVWFLDMLLPTYQSTDHQSFIQFLHKIRVLGFIKSLGPVFWGHPVVWTAIWHVYTCATAPRCRQVVINCIIQTCEWILVMDLYLSGSQGNYSCYSRNLLLPGTTMPNSGTILWIVVGDHTRTLKRWLTIATAVPGLFFFFASTKIKQGS